MLTKEDLQAIEDIMDRKLLPLQREISMIRVDLLENNVIPRLNTIENHHSEQLRNLSGVR